MTPKSPEEIAAELYLYESGTELHVTNKKRAAWLSRQAEVDELNKELEFYKTYKWDRDELVDEVIPELKRQVEEMKAAHDAEMCAFAEWCCKMEGEQKNTYYIPQSNFWWHNHNKYTTTELLKRFRDDHKK
jgi:hypothetical protein